MLSYEAHEAVSKLREPVTEWCSPGKPSIPIFLRILRILLIVIDVNGKKVDIRRGVEIGTTPQEIN